jgi:hypothetical protein
VANAVPVGHSNKCPRLRLCPYVGCKLSNLKNQPMLYIVWGFLNLVLFVFVLFLFVKGVIFIREKIGIGAAMIFVFIVLSFKQAYNGNDNTETNSNQLKTWKFESPDSLDKASNGRIEIDLEHTKISTYHLGVGYGKDKELKRKIPTSANTWTTGIEFGTSWKPISIIVNQTNQTDKFHYDVEGTIKWKLLGFTVYSQQKKWTGEVIAK